MVLSSTFLVLNGIRFLFESKYQVLINGRERVGIKKLKYPQAFIDYLQTIDNIYENLEDYNPAKKKSLNSFLWYQIRKLIKK